MVRPFGDDFPKDFQGSGELGSVVIIDPEKYNREIPWWNRIDFARPISSINTQFLHWGDEYNLEL